MEIRAGTSGFAYPAWRGSFYPEKTRPADMLRRYAERLPAVEINNTFYRMPTRELLEGWAGRVPETFRFAVKAPRRITHRKRLADVGDDVDFLLGQLAQLGPRLGVLFFQLPPTLRADPPRLARLLDRLDGRVRTAFEFRHPSWEDAETLDLLRAHRAALVLADTEEGTPELHATAPFGYLRLRRPSYAREDLSAWLERLHAAPWDEAYVFFKHEDAGVGPALAEALLGLAGGSSRRP